MRKTKKLKGTKMQTKRIPINDLRAEEFKPLQIKESTFSRLRIACAITKAMNYEMIEEALEFYYKNINLKKYQLEGGQLDKLIKWVEDKDK